MQTARFSVSWLGNRERGREEGEEGGRAPDSLAPRVRRPEGVLRVCSVLHGTPFCCKSDDHTPVSDHFMYLIFPFAATCVVV